MVKVLQKENLHLKTTFGTSTSDFIDPPNFLKLDILDIC